MRSISLVDKLEVEFEGNVMQNALKFGDVDNDGCSELAAGNVYGYLAVYKGMGSKPWRYAHDLGLIACVQVGDIFNTGKNCLLVFSDDGRCNIFYFELPATQGDSDAETSSASFREYQAEVRSIYSQCLPANIKDALLADIDGDGKLELVCSLTDRIVRTYKWQPAVRASGEEGSANPAASANTHCPPVGNGYLMAVNKWELSRQIGNISTSMDSGGGSYLLISQPGGTYVSLQHSTSIDTRPRENTTMDSDHNVLQNHLLGYSQARNKNITTEIVGGIGTAPSDVGKASALALCTTDGTISLVDGDDILWSFQVDHQLFGIGKLDVTGDGRCELIVGSGCGTTYIVDCNMNAVRFQLGEDIRTFHAGFFSTTARVGNQPAFAYVTYNSQIVTYYNVSNINMKMLTLQGHINNMDNPTDIPRLLSQIQSDTEAANAGHSATDIYRFCLYGLPALVRDRANAGTAAKKKPSCDN